MQKITVGMVLVSKHNLLPYRVLEKTENLVCLSFTTNHDAVSDWNTLKEIEQNFTLPEEKWEPKEGDVYYFIEEGFRVNKCDWLNNYIDRRRLSLGNYFEDESSAQKKADELKAVLLK